MGHFPGFPRGTKYTPVPNLLLEALLDEIEDVGELKCTLRFLCMANQHKGFPSAVPMLDLLEDRTLLAALKGPQEMLQVYEGKYQGAMQSLGVEQQGRNRTDEYKLGIPRTPVKGGKTPRNV